MQDLCTIFGKIKNDTIKTKSASLTTVQQTQGLAFANNIRENKDAYRELTTPQQNINGQITIAQGNAFRRANNRDASK